MVVADVESAHPKTQSSPKKARSTGTSDRLALGRLGSSGYLMNIPVSGTTPHKSAKSAKA